MKRISRQQEGILEYMAMQRVWISPTTIGTELHRGGESAWASPKCLSLVRHGLLERDSRGRYRVTLEGLKRVQLAREGSEG